MRKNRVAILVVVLGSLTLLRTQRYYGRLLHGWDAQFYYAMAHSLVFDRDVEITNDLELTPWPEPFDRDGDGVWESVPRGPNGHIRTKYPLGMSLLEAPFLLLGHALRRALALTGITVVGPPGYSDVEVATVAVGLVSLFAVAIQALFNLMSRAYARWDCALAIAASCLGTSLFYYAFIFPFMAHAMGFALLVAALTALAGIETHTNAHLALIGLVLAGLFLVRPQELMVAPLLLPALFSAARTRQKSQWIPGAICGGIAFAAGMVLQLWVNLQQTGTFTLNAYSRTDGGFSWLSPDFGTVLVSPNRGLLVFSPVVLLGLGGLMAAVRRIPTYVWPFVGNAIVQIYLIAAWSSPAQGDSFGARMWSENAAVVAFGLAVALQYARGSRRAALIAATLASITWTNLLLLRYIGYWR